MKNAEWIIMMSELILTTILIVLVAITQISLGKKLDKLIELNTPEAIQLIIPEKPLLEK